MKSAPAQIVREYGPSPASPMSTASATTAAGSGSPPAIRCNRWIRPGQDRQHHQDDGARRHRLRRPAPVPARRSEHPEVDPRSARSWPLPAPAELLGMAWAEGALWWRITASARSTRSTRPRARSCAPSPRTATSPASPGPTAACGTAPGKTTKASCAASRPKPARCRRACSCPGRLRLRAGSGRRRVLLRRQHQRQDPRRAPASPRPKAAERTPPPEPGGGASRLAPLRGAGPGRQLHPQGNPSVFPLHPPAAPWGRSAASV